LRAAGPYARVTTFYGVDKGIKACKEEVRELKRQNADIMKTVAELRAIIMSGGMQRPMVGEGGDHFMAPCMPTSTQSASGSCNMAERPASIPLQVPIETPKDQQCLLGVHGSSDIVAKGKVMDYGGPGAILHGRELGQGNYKVMVTVAFENDALVPCPTDEVETVYDAVGGIVAWPSELVIFDMEVLFEISFYYFH